MGNGNAVTIENTGVALARQAAEALRALGEYGPHLAPDGADRFLWSADVLDELARVAVLLGDAVGQAAGDPSVGVDQHAQQLATAVVAHRNSLLRHGRGSDPFDTRDGGRHRPDRGGHPDADTAADTDADGAADADADGAADPGAERYTDPGTYPDTYQDPYGDPRPFRARGDRATRPVTALRSA